MYYFFNQTKTSAKCTSKCYRNNVANRKQGQTIVTIWSNWKKIVRLVEKSLFVYMTSFIEIVNYSYYKLLIQHSLIIDSKVYFLFVSFEMESSLKDFLTIFALEKYRFWFQMNWLHVNLKLFLSGKITFTFQTKKLLVIQGLFQIALIQTV